MIYLSRNNHNSLGMVDALNFERIFRVANPKASRLTGITDGFKYN